MITSHSSEVVDNLAASLFKYSIIVDVVFLAFSLLDVALCPDDAKQDPVVYGTEFGVMFLAKGPPTSPIQ